MVGGQELMKKNCNKRSSSSIKSKTFTMRTVEHWTCCLERLCRLHPQRLSRSRGLGGWATRPGLIGGAALSRSLEMYWGPFQSELSSGLMKSKILLVDNLYGSWHGFPDWLFDSPRPRLLKTRSEILHVASRLEEVRGSWEPASGCLPCISGGYAEWQLTGSASQRWDTGPLEEGGYT